MEEDGRGEAQRIQTVEHAAVAFDHGTPVLDAAVTLDGGHHQATRKAHEVDEDGDECGLPPGKGRDPEERCAQQGGQQPGGDTQQGGQQQGGSIQGDNQPGGQQPGQQQGGEGQQQPGGQQQGGADSSAGTQQGGQQGGGN